MSTFMCVAEQEVSKPDVKLPDTSEVGASEEKKESAASTWMSFWFKTTDVVDPGVVVMGWFFFFPLSEGCVF